MFKKSLFTMLMLAVIGYVSAQSIQFEYDGNVFYDGEAIECTNDEYGIGELIQHMNIRNLTSTDMNVIVEKEVVEDLEGTYNLFCFAGNCFSPDTYVSPASPVPANGLNVDDLSFHVAFEPDVYGCVVMKYYAYDELQPDQRISIIVKFLRSGEGVADNVRQIEMSQAYPNPASSMVNFDYSLNAGDRASVSVYNLLGQEVVNQQVNSLQDRLSISVADLNDGIYFCKLFVNGCAVKTEKFVVKK